MKLSDLEKLAEAMGGLTVLGALEGSPFQRAGLRYGDILLEVNGQATPDLTAYAAALRVNPAIPGTLSMKIFRGGAELELTVKGGPFRAPSTLADVLKAVEGLLPRAPELPLPAKAPSA